MKKIILSCLSILLFANIANAMNDIESLKSYVSDELNSTVSILKNYFKKTDTDLKEKKVIVEDAKLKAEVLKASSSEKETNPVVLNQGLVAMPNCDTETQELAWNNDKWICRTPTYGTDCMPASDEYRYEEDGKMVCTKYAKGSSLDYYWKFRGYSANCDSANNKFKIYGCYYNNKNNQEIEISDDYCSGKSKQSQVNKSCRIECITEREPKSGQLYEDYHTEWIIHRLNHRLILTWKGSKIYDKIGVDIYGDSIYVNGWTYHKGDTVFIANGDWYGEIGFKIYRTRVTNADVCTP
jgi:hypothetical protein